tara:strand:- start:693 stop:833 length:141 start_codon:yes stop_codon:yes gene_type:complete
MERGTEFADSPTIPDGAAEGEPEVDEEDKEGVELEPVGPGFFSISC